MEDFVYTLKHWNIIIFSLPRKQRDISLNIKKLFLEMINVFIIGNKYANLCKKIPDDGN